MKRILDFKNADVDQAMAMLAQVWRRGWVFLAAVPGSASTKATRSKHIARARSFYWPDEQPQVRQYLLDHWADHDLYFTPLSFWSNDGDPPPRTNEHAHRSWLLFADYDGKGNPLDVDPPPTYAWETSPGKYHAIWLLDERSEHHERGGLNHRLVRATGADVGKWSPSTFLRVPGSNHFKGGERKAGRFAAGAGVHTP